MANRTQATALEADTQLTIIRVPLKKVARVHPAALAAAQHADAAYLAEHLTLVSPDAGTLLLSLEPIVVVHQRRKLRRIAGHRTFAVVSQLLPEETPVPALWLRRRPSDFDIAQIAAYDAIVHRLLTSLNESAVDQIHRMCEDLEPGYTRTTRGRPRKDSDTMDTPLRRYFHRRLQQNTLHEIVGMARGTRRRRPKKVDKPGEGGGTDV